MSKLTRAVSNHCPCTQGNRPDHDQIRPIASSINRRLLSQQSRPQPACQLSAHFLPLE